MAIKTNSDPKSEKYSLSDNFNKTKEQLGYVSRDKATSETYSKLGFMCGLEIHQQLLTDQKLFCRCPAGIFQEKEDYDAELVRHMRPTLSELGEYDGTALMEFRTKKNIIYRIKDATACTYDIDDTPPFPMNRQALAIALEIGLLLGSNIVGEFHIARKQYLDGSIPAGFQRTGIVGIEGEIEISNKKIRIIQISLEEDSCREVSDIGHWRIYRTDRLGMPLIETVTYPDMKTPDESAEAAQYLRFLARSSGKVRTGIGSARQDVNVSVTGGTRVEIKGVAHIKWIPELTHNEAFRQSALLRIKDTLHQRVSNPKDWKLTHQKLEIDPTAYFPIEKQIEGHEYIAVNLPSFGGLLSHFTQPNQDFADEISGRLKVIPCLDTPNLVHSEQNKPELLGKLFDSLKNSLNASHEDAQLIFWGPSEDIRTALETIDERCLLAFEGVPNETRKSFPDGTTIFERVLPGPDRMYPDTDSAPISITEDLIEQCRANLVDSVVSRQKQLNDWNIPKNWQMFILKRNLVPLLEQIHTKTDIPVKRAARLIAQDIKHLEGYRGGQASLPYSRLGEMCKFVSDQKLCYEILDDMLQLALAFPDKPMLDVLKDSGYKKTNPEELLALIPKLIEQFQQLRGKKKQALPEPIARWVMGMLRPLAVGNMPLRDLFSKVTKEVWS